MVIASETFFLLGLRKGMMENEAMHGQTLGIFQTVSSLYPAT